MASDRHRSFFSNSASDIGSRSRATSKNAARSSLPCVSTGAVSAGHCCMSYVLLEEFLRHPAREEHLCDFRTNALCYASHRDKRVLPSPKQKFMIQKKILKTNQLTIALLHPVVPRESQQLHANMFVCSTARRSATHLASDDHFLTGQGTAIPYATS
ncbi:uncharacterized protein SPSK_09917 [Sporothrix schenckii 1099-18]|uniref:Uncharacterized protein n=1 Tax=Sporothrix schenckii 1099-18 TaxID=1397361 RepID=A0A0F2M6C8_SPOSC|nr:uncharacterized protein SPSK_09917 [Sporothrix schenckii 1099-18]KJR84644.1 hypothetical protein SPSK_09917 [Sporothrix schenckii 1099-18]